MSVPQRRVLEGESAQPSRAFSKPSGHEAHRAKAVAETAKERRRSSVVRMPISDETHLTERLTAEEVHPEQMPELLKYDKTAETLSRLAEAVANNALFIRLEAEERQTVFAAMFEFPCVDGQVVIRQGEAADLFFVVESGEYEAWKVCTLPRASGGRAWATE